jgi:predicted small secreted protein
MLPMRRKCLVPIVLCAISLSVAACGRWEGAKDVNTDIGSGAMGNGAGLVTGKRGGIIIYNDVWTGAVPGGGASE